MAQTNDIGPAGAAKTLKGLADRLAAAVSRRAEAFIAEAADPKTLDAALRSIALIARAAIAVQALQAVEEKADARAHEAHAQRLLFAARGHHPKPTEGDETDMDERDPRLDDPDALAEVSEEIGRRVDRLAEFLEQKRAARAPGAAAATGRLDPLDRSGPAGSVAA